MDTRIRQLEADGVEGLALIPRMAGHLPDLHRIWTGTSDKQLAMLCQDYPGFYRYASLMEEAAETERQQPTTWHRDLPELPELLKKHLASLLVKSATLERRYHSVLDSGKRTGLPHEVDRLRELHRAWTGEREEFMAALNATEVPRKAVEFLSHTLDEMAQRIIQLEARARGR
jgi:uncharacterized protein YecT (DUF1311 family)